MRCEAAWYNDESPQLCVKLAEPLEAFDNVPDARSCTVTRTLHHSQELVPPSLHTAAHARLVQVGEVVQPRWPSCDRVTAPRADAAPFFESAENVHCAQCVQAFRSPGKFVQQLFQRFLAFMKFASRSNAQRLGSPKSGSGTRANRFSRSAW
jgi:hypothetical protein